VSKSVYLEERESDIVIRRDVVIRVVSSMGGACEYKIKNNINFKDNLIFYFTIV